MCSDTSWMMYLCCFCVVYFFWSLKNSVWIAPLLFLPLHKALWSCFFCSHGKFEKKTNKQKVLMRRTKKMQSLTKTHTKSTPMYTRKKEKEVPKAETKEPHKPKKSNTKHHWKPQHTQQKHPTRTHTQKQKKKQRERKWKAFCTHQLLLFFFDFSLSLASTSLFLDEQEEKRKKAQRERKKEKKKSVWDSLLLSSLFCFCFCLRLAGGLGFVCGQGFQGFVRVEAVFSWLVLWIGSQHSHLFHFNPFFSRETGRGVFSCFFRLLCFFSCFSSSSASFFFSFQRERHKKRLFVKSFFFLFPHEVWG